MVILETLLWRLNKCKDSLILLPMKRIQAYMTQIDILLVSLLRGYVCLLILCPRTNPYKTVWWRILTGSAYKYSVPIDCRVGWFESRLGNGHITWEYYAFLVSFFFQRTTTYCYWMAFNLILVAEKSCSKFHVKSHTWNSDGAFRGYLIH